MPAPHHNFLQAGCPSWCIVNSVKASTESIFKNITSQKRTYYLHRTNKPSKTHTARWWTLSVLVVLGSLQSARQRVTMWSDGCWLLRRGQTSSRWWWTQPHLNLQLSGQFLKLSFGTTWAGRLMDGLVAQACNLTYNTAMFGLNRLVTKFKSKCCQILQFLTDPKSNRLTDSFTLDSDSTSVLESLLSSFIAVSL